MLKKTLVAAALAGLSTAALAHPPAYGYRAHYYHRHYVRYYPVPVRPRPVIVAPAPVIVPPHVVIRLRFPL